MQSAPDLDDETVPQLAEGGPELSPIEELIGSDAEPFRLATLDAIESDILGVASAIEALDNGTYGRCGFCGSDISAGELAADPLAAHCRSHR